MRTIDNLRAIYSRQYRNRPFPGSEHDWQHTPKPESEYGGDYSEGLACGLNWTLDDRHKDEHGVLFNLAYPRNGQSIEQFFTSMEVSPADRSREFLDGFVRAVWMIDSLIYANEDPDFDRILEWITDIDASGKYTREKTLIALARCHQHSVLEATEELFQGRIEWPAAEAVIERLSHEEAEREQWLNSLFSALRRDMFGSIAAWRRYAIEQGHDGDVDELIKNLFEQELTPPVIMAD